LFVELLIAVIERTGRINSPLEGMYSIEIVAIMVGGLLIRITNYRIDGRLRLSTCENVVVGGPTEVRGERSARAKITLVVRNGYPSIPFHGDQGTEYL